MFDFSNQHKEAKNGKRGPKKALQKRVNRVLTTNFTEKNA